MSARARLYGLVAFAALIAGWASLRGLPLARDARHYESELKLLPTTLPRGTPSAAALQSELAQLRAEEERLDASARAFAARAAKSSEDTLEGRLRAAGLQVEALRTALRGRNRAPDPWARPPDPSAARALSSRRVPETYLVVEAGGDFAQTRRFVSSLEALGAPLQIDRFTLSLERELDRAGPLRLSLEVRP